MYLSTLDEITTAPVASSVAPQPQAAVQAGKRPLAPAASREEIYAFFGKGR